MDNQQVDLVEDENLALRFLELDNEIVLYDEWIAHFNDTDQSYGCCELLFSSIPKPNYPSLLPATCFYAALKKYHGCWPNMKVINAYTRLKHNFPKPDGSAVNPNLSNALAQELEEAVKEYIKGPTSLFATSDSPALIDPLSERSLSHRELSSFIQNFRLPIKSERLSKRKLTVAIALPNGLSLGLACLAVSCHYTAAPVDISGGPTQLQKDVELIQPQVILSRSQDVKRLGLDKEWVKHNKIVLLVLDEDSNMKFTVRKKEGITIEGIEDCIPSYEEEIAFILLTSGTSGTKKVVPVSTMSLLTGTSCVITSWGLISQDSCINMMPLNHIGGLVRNLFAPVLSGGSTILCPSFDPNLFWDLVIRGQGTWYYASPSMHASILFEKDFRNYLFLKNNIRLVCNASGALLPSLATRLRDAFNCIVLPSYGMTECMPISTPPLNYNLERPGTSGISCGPDVAIFNSKNMPLFTGEIGHICVRGGPTFAGYLKNGMIDTKSLSESGWFNTGDLGYLDADGYLFLTGRSKEVINRGGEIISPFEVEEAIITASNTKSSPLYQRIKAALAFSVPHYLLQEVVGVIIVPYKEKPRPDLRLLQTSLKNDLHNSKLPAIIVYMDELPTNNNKVVRVKLSERMNLEPINENTKFFEKHFDATCPPLNSSLDTQIETTTCSINTQLIKDTISHFIGPETDLFVREQPQNGLAEIIIFHEKEYLLEEDLKKSMFKHMQEHLPGYQVPADIIFLNSPIPRINSISIDEIEVDKIINRNFINDSTLSFSETQLKIISAMSKVLDIPNHVIKLDSDFFQLGGDSLNAGRLLSILRRDYQIQIPIHHLFTTSTVKDLSELVGKLNSMTELQTETDLSSLDVRTTGKEKTHSNTNPILLAIQILPIALFYPLKLAFWFTMFLYTLSFLSRSWRDTHLVARYITLLIAITISSLSCQIAAPVLGIMLKWIIIGRYKAGNYHMWGSYHTRWWIVDKILLVCGKGVFEYTQISMLMYYRVLGASIGSGVVIEPDTQLGEFDLLKIDDNVHLNRCICRPFACESNTQFFLGKIHIGRNCSIGLKSYVAAGSFVPANTYMGPNTSTYEKDDALEDHRGTTNGKLPKPHFLLRLSVIIPLQLIVLFISSLPWMIALIGVVESKPAGNSRLGVLTIIRWWALPRRIAFHYVAALSHVLLSPLVRLASIIFIKKILDKICGRKISRSNEEFTPLEIFRTALMDSLEPNRSFLLATKLFGSHYEVTSIAARALGAKVGKRVYWPGTGPYIEDFDLLDIGDDVVFGSRSYLVTRDGHGSLAIKIEAGAMIADRVVLSPGTIIESRAIMGSGATTRRNQVCPLDSIWIGKKNGSAVCLSQPWTMSEKLKNDTKSSSVSSQNGRYYDLKATTDIIRNKEGSCLDSEFFLNEFKDELPPNKKINSSISNSSVSMNIPTSKSKEKMSPFGRAFYNREAPYYVLPMYIIFLYTMVISAITRIFWDTNVIANLLLFMLIKYTTLLERRPVRSFIIYSFNVCFLSVLLIFKSLLSLAIIIAAKWIIIGRRKPGNYNWDKSSYCQRWKLFVSIESLRTRCFGEGGVLGMFTGTFYLVLYYRLLGAKIGSNTAIFAGGLPSAYITEPDLLTVGNRVSIDDASLVAHINSRGNFDLRLLSVEDGAVMRSGTRLLSGASMGRGSKLLEHTLIMAGDRADDELVFQGWPAEPSKGINKIIE